MLKHQEPWQHAVVFSELDQNGHVNNTRYINWMLDTLPTKFHHKNEVTDLQANYLAEVFPDQHIQIYWQEIAVGKFLFECIDAKGMALFRGNILFNPLP